MAKKVWIKGFTRDDGTKVKGHYREVEQLYGDRKADKTLASKVRLTGDAKG